MRKRLKTNPQNKILIYLAEVSDDSKRIKYWIEKETKLAKQTLYNSILYLSLLGLIREKEVGKARTGLPMKRYYLTPRGWYKAYLLKPQLKKSAEEELEKFGRPLWVWDQEHERVRKAEVDFLLEIVRNALTNERGRPGSSFNLNIIADEHGHATYNIKLRGF